MNLSLQSIAAALGGEIVGDEVLAPGPGHSTKDRSLSVKIAPGTPDGILVHSFANDDWQACKDHAKQRLGIQLRPDERPRGTGAISRVFKPKPAAQVAQQAETKAHTGPRSVVAEYVYKLADGTPHTMAVRTEPKGFFQRHWDGSGWRNGGADASIPYRLPELKAAVHDTVFICEGEKDCDNLAKHGFVATCNISGAGKWRAELNEHFLGKDVYILADNDDAGAKHAQEVAQHLASVAASVRIVNLPGLPPKGDVSNWLDAGGDHGKLIELCKAAPVFEPTHVLSPSGLRFPFKLTTAYNDFAKPKPFIIKPILVCSETSGWIGAPGSMKSALACSAAFAAASGADWFGFKNKSGPVGVAYFALERSDLVHRRIAAHRERTGTQTVPIAVVPGMVDLMREGTVDDVLATIRAAESEMGVGVCLGVFDTTAKMIAASGGDEDKARDQGALFANIQRVKDATGIHAMLIGHTGKDQTRGARGSNAILGDVDVMVQIAGERIRTATVTKANDMADGPLFSFGSEVHGFGTDEDGDPIAVNVAVEVDAQIEQQGEPELRLTPNQNTMFAILHEAGSRGLTTEQWNEAGRAAGVGTKRRADLHDIRATLKGKRLVRETMTGWAVIHD